MEKNKITLCLCASRSIIDREKAIEVADRLREIGYTVEFEADLCEKAMSSSEMKDIVSTTILACYPRAILSLFNRWDLVPHKVVDIRTGSRDEILNNFNISEKTEVQKTVIDSNLLSSKTGKDAWYPVIDKERCTNCGKCHDFCLFGVYSTNDENVEVKSPQNCKNNCPACARVCPQKAIIFPKYDKSPINGGLTDEEQILSVNTKVLYNDALRLKLAQRKAGISLLKKNDDSKRI